MNETKLTRRDALLAGGAALAAPHVARVASTPARAEAEMLGARQPNFRRYTIGEFEITSIHDGAIQLDGPHPIFGQNVEAEQVRELAKANFLPPSRFEISFTPVIVNTGASLIVFDTGNGAGRRPNAGHLAAQFATTGYEPGQVDTVVITHFHPDHIGGIMEDGQPLFPNASYVINRIEYDFWTHPDRMSGPTERVATLVESNVKPIAGKATFIEDGADVTSGIRAVAAYGHTPGHSAFHIESGGERLLLGGDFCNHYVVSLERPDWHVRFDMDKEAAVATRKKILGMLASDRIPFTSYHMPFPAVGFVEAAGGTFRYVPATYQLDM